jgi:hypothetical protein
VDGEKPAQGQLAGVGAVEAERQGHKHDGGEYYYDSHQPRDLQQPRTLSIDWLSLYQNLRNEIIIILVS